MRAEKLIMYAVGEKVSMTKLKKDLESDFDEALELGYFIKNQENSDDEPKYIFTKKGKDAAWAKKK